VGWCYQEHATLIILLVRLLASALLLRLLLPCSQSWTVCCSI
jgi:hypothetical protein